MQEIRKTTLAEDFFIKKIQLERYIQNWNGSQRARQNTILVQENKKTTPSLGQIKSKLVSFWLKEGMFFNQNKLTTFESDEQVQVSLSTGDIIKNIALYQWSSFMPE